MSNNHEFFLDSSRCIGCQACVQACAECGTHRGASMIHLEYVDRAVSTQTGPVICMHCEDPTCARVCPADAIKQTDDGVVQSSLKPRCIGCSNCVLACPFGVPRYKVEIDQMMKCDMCYDRTSVGKKPMCATVCPSGALYYGPRDFIERTRKEHPINEFKFGNQIVRTKVNLMTAPDVMRLDFDIAAFMPEENCEVVESRTGAPDVAGLVDEEGLLPEFLAGTAPRVEAHFQGVQPSAAAGNAAATDPTGTDTAADVVLETAK